MGNWGRAGRFRPVLLLTLRLMKTRITARPSAWTLRLTAAAAAATLGAGLAGAPGLAADSRSQDPADRQKRLTSQIANSRGDLDDLSVESARALRALRATEAAVGQARAAQRAAQERKSAAQAQERTLRARLAGAKAREQAGLDALRRNAAQTAQAQDRRDELARIAYESGGSAELVSFFDLSGTIELADRMQLATDAGGHHQAVAVELREVRLERLEQQAKLEEARREIAQLTVQAQAAAKRAEAAHATATAKTRELNDLAARQRTQRAAVDARRAAEARRLATLQAESDQITALLRERARQQEARARAARAARAAAAKASAGSAAQRESAARTSPSSVTRFAAAGRSVSAARTNGAPRDTGARLLRPVTSTAGSPFGMRMHPVLRYKRLHAGLDFRSPCGTPVYAADSGQVWRAGWAGGYGNHIVVGHSGGLATSYSHLQSIGVSSGWVERGQLIGYSGTTGLSTGCHLHFEARVNGTPVDPADFF